MHLVTGPRYTNLGSKKMKKERRKKGSAYSGSSRQHFKEH